MKNQNTQHQANDTSKDPVHLTQEVAALSEMFIDYPPKPIFGADLLNREQLDFSLVSLHCVDDYLAQVRTRSFNAENLFDVTLRTGAYLGEVIRRASADDDWAWVSYDRALRAFPGLAADCEKGLESSILLVSRHRMFALPMAVVLKGLFCEPSDRVWKFGAVFIEAAKAMTTAKKHGCK